MTLYGKDILLLDDGGEFRTVKQVRLLGHSNRARRKSAK